MVPGSRLYLLVKEIRQENKLRCVCQYICPQQNPIVERTGSVCMEEVNNNNDNDNTTNKAVSL